MINRSDLQGKTLPLSNIVSLSDPSVSNIFSEDFEGLLEASDKLAHVAQQLVLVVETIVHFTVQVVHEGVCLRRCLLLKVLQECACHVGALRKHIIQVTKALFTRLLLILDVCVHLVTFTVDVCHDLLLICYPCLLLFHKTFCDTLDLRSDWVESIIVILDSVLLFLDDCGFKLIPTVNQRCHKTVSDGRAHNLLLTFSDGSLSKSL